MSARRVIAIGLLAGGLGIGVSACTSSDTNQGEVVNVEELGPDMARLRLEVQRLREEVRSLREEVAALTPTTALPDEARP